MSLFQKLKATVSASGFVDAASKQANAQRQARIEAERQASRPINNTPQVDYEAVLSSLDKRYLDAKYDPVAELVAALPLSQGALDTFLEDTKPKQQLMLDAIQHRLSREVMANYTSFVDGMRQLSEIDMDVSRAAIHVSNSLRKLSNAKESLVSGTLGITYRRRRRERLAEVKLRSEWLRSLVTVEDRVDKACKEHRYSDGVHIVNEGNSKLADPNARTYAVVNSLKVRVDGALDTLMDRIDRSLEAQLISFDPLVYGAILQAYRDLDDHGIKARSHHHRKEGGGGAGLSRADRQRAGTIDDGSNFLESFPGGGNTNELDESSFGINTGSNTIHNENINPGQSLLQEVGSSIAVAASLNNNTGIMSIKHIGPVDGNIASLPQTLQRAAASATKSLTKDIVIDVLLKDVRARITEAEQNAAARKRAGYDDNESVTKHDNHDDDLLGNIENMKPELEDETNGRDRSGSTTTKSKLPPEQEYTRRRNELRGLPYNHLCATLKAEDIPLAAMAVSAGITHVMHQHYLILQWHRAPYDYRNNYEGQEYLHRCGTDEPEPVMDDTENDRNTNRSTTTTTTTANTARPRKPTDPVFIEVLRLIRPFLLRTRVTAWSSMQQRYSAMLFAAVGSESLNIPVERLAQILILSRDLMSVGLEYVGHGQKHEGETISIELDPCNTLRGSLRLLCSQYMDAIHGECFSRLRDMLAKENWQSIPMTDAGFVSLMDTASAGFKTKFSKQATAAVQAATAAIMGADINNNDNTDGNDDGEPLYRTYSDGASLFSSWLERGNPFGCVVLPPKSTTGTVAEEGTTNASSSSTTLTISATGTFVQGATVLHTPRPPVPNDGDDDDDDDDDDNVPHDAAWQAKRAQAKLMRSIHGDGYHLDIGLGRGPSLGFNFSLSGEAGGDKTHGESDDDLSDSSEEIIDDATSGSSDEDEDDDRRGRRIKRSDDSDAGGLNGATATGVGGPFATAFAGKHGHTVTAAALNGFAKALGKYVLLMEVLPTVSSDAFTGLARLFELYLYTVATLFLRPPAQRQLFDIATPTPQYVEKLVDSSVFEYVDGTAFHVAAKVGAAACEARDADHGKLMAASNNRNLRRTMTSYTSNAGALDRSFSSDGGSSSIPGSARKGRNGRTNDNDDMVTMYGVTLYTRGLPCIAQAQGFSSEYYTPLGAGASIGNVLLGHIWNSDAVYLTLRRALQQIGADLSSGARSMGTGSTSVLADGHFSMDTGVSVRGLVPEPYVKLQANIEIEGEQATFGIVERCVAVESLDFLLDVMFRVRSRIESHLSASHATSISQFYTRAVQCCVQLRALIYHSMVPRLLPESGALPNMISSVKWESIKDAMEPSKYAITDLPPYITRAANVLNDRMKNNGLPAISRFGIWTCIVSHIMERFVEGYSHVKKCTVPGRGLMSLDAGTLYASCTRASTIIPTCLARDRSFVDSYIAAFYFDNESDLLDWINKNRAAYALHHIRGLINYGIGPNLKKKNLKDILTTIDSMYVVPPPEDLQKQAKEVAQMGITGLSMMGAAMMGNTV